MRYILVDFSDGHCGSDEREALMFDDDKDDDYIDWICEHYFAEYIDSHDTDAGDPDDYYSEEEYQADYESFVENCRFDWFEITDDPRIIKLHKWTKC